MVSDAFREEAKCLNVIISFLCGCVSISALLHFVFPCILYCWLYIIPKKIYYDNTNVNCIFSYTFLFLETFKFGAKFFFDGCADLWLFLLLNVKSRFGVKNFSRRWFISSFFFWFSCDILINFKKYYNFQEQFSSSQFELEVRIRQFEFFVYEPFDRVEGHTLPRTLFSFVIEHFIKNFH